MEKTERFADGWVTRLRRVDRNRTVVTGKKKCSYRFTKAGRSPVMSGRTNVRTVDKYFSIRFLSHSLTLHINQR